MEPIHPSEIPFLSPDLTTPSKPFGDMPNNAAMAFDPAATGPALRGDGIELERVVDDPNFLPASFLELGAQRSRAVCKIKAQGTDYDGNPGEWSGTGFLVSENILLTNHHVINSMEVAKESIAIFNYEADVHGRVKSTIAYHLNPMRLFITSEVKDMDFTFVWVEGEPGKEFGFIPMKRLNFTIKEKEFANIVQHPAGEPKAVSLQENRVFSQNSLALLYHTDTLSGSSGSPVFNNEWNLVALHHASRKVENKNLNEGIKMAAIATSLELSAVNPETENSANEVLRLFSEPDTLMGYFGALGRDSKTESVTTYETLVDTYKGEAHDLDIGFWNIEWFNKNYKTKIDAVSRIISSMNLDIWGLSEVSPNSVKELVDHLNSKYQLEYQFAVSEPEAPEARQTTAVIWNARTVKGERRNWPAKLEEWFQVDSSEFSDTMLESVDGKVFNRYPGLFFFEAANRQGLATFNFHLVPLHLKAMSEGSTRRKLASKILSVAIQRMIEEGNDADWVLGGDFNAELASRDFNDLIGKNYMALSAKDEEEGAISYVKGRFKSLIDHIFVSGNMSKLVGVDDFFVVAKDRTFPEYLALASDHRPVLMRISLKPRAAASGEGNSSESIEELKQVLGKIGS